MSVPSALLLLVGAQTPCFVGALSLQPHQTSIAKEVVGVSGRASFVGGILPFAAPRQTAGAEFMQEGAALDSAFPGEPSTCSSNPQPEFVPSKAAYDHFAWVHIPKTGTGFVNALANYACRMEPGSDCVDPDFWPGYALRKENVQPCADQFVGLPFLKADFEWHTAVDNEVLAKYDSSLITMLREPMEHKKSWYAHKIVNEKLHAPQGAEVADDDFVPTLQQWLETHRGLQVGFLLGMDTFNPLHVTQADLQEAKRRIREDFAFVGLTERWADSMCLFHATFGGGRCKGCEFAEVNTAREAVKVGDRVPWEPNDEELRILEEYHDEFDEELLAEARRLFEAAWTRRGVTKERCVECGCATSSKRPETW